MDVEWPTGDELVADVGGEAADAVAVTPDAPSGRTVKAAVPVDGDAPIEVQADQDTAPVADAPVAAAADPASTAFDARFAAIEQSLAQSSALNDRLLSLLERQAQPQVAAVPEPAPVDELAGLDPNDPDDKIEIAVRIARQAVAHAKSLQAELANRDSQRGQQDAEQYAQSAMFNAIEDACKGTGLDVSNRIKDTVFRAVSQEWGASNYDKRTATQMVDNVRERVAELAGFRKQGVSAAVRPLATAAPQARAPVKGTGSAAAAVVPPPRKWTFDDEDLDRESVRWMNGDRN